MDNKKFEDIIKQPPKVIEEYLTADNVRADRPTKDQLLELIKATENIDKYIAQPGEIRNFLRADDIVELIISKGKAEEYLSHPERLLFDNKLTANGRAIANSPLGRRRRRRPNPINKLIKETGNIEKYLTPETITNFWLDNDDITELIKETRNIEKYLFEGQDEYSLLSIANVIKATGNIEKYLTLEAITNFRLYNNDINKLIKATGNIEKYLFEGQDEYSSFSIANIIKATGNIEKYLTPETITNFRLDNKDINKLIKATGDIEKYLFEGEDEDSLLSIANVIKETGNVEKYLTPEMITHFNLGGSDIVKLIKETGNIEKYLTPETITNFNLYSSDITKLIKATGNIEKYLTPEIVVDINNYDITKLIKATGNIEKYLLDGEDGYSLLSIANVIKGLNLCPNLNDREIKLFNKFDSEITKTILNIDVEKQKNAIILLQRLDKNNSAELRRIKIPMALQILEKDPESYEETLSRIEEIYLTNDIPNVGKSYLVFQELHPNFLGLDNNKKDESSAVIPSLQNASVSERKHLIFTNLLMCALESNDRNIRDYIKVIDNGDKLYRDYLEGRLELENLDEDNEKIKILSRYSSILNTLYNVTSNGRREKPRRNSGNLGNDLKELDKLFESDRIKLNLPDRLVRTFAFGSNIRTFEQAKSIFKNSRENAHERNIAISKQGGIRLEEGDFIKGIAASEYFPSMLQRGILAKDFLGRNANSDATPLDTDVEKITSIKESFSETLNSLSIANNFTNGDVSGKALGSIMLVFSKDDFIETRDSSGNVNQENVELIKNGNNKKEVFYNFDSAYGICTGIGSTHIKCIVADRYVDKVGLEIAKNGFYIPIVDKSGKVIYTEKMYEDFREKMRGLSYYNGDKFVLDETAINEDIKQIAKDIDLNLKNANEKKEKIVKVLKCATEKMGYSLSEKRRTDLMPGIVELIDTGSTGRGTNEPGTGDFDFMVRMDKQLSDSPTELKNEYIKAFGDVKEPSETGKGDFRYKGVTVEGLNNPVDLDLTFTERTDEIEYTTDECIKERLKNIKDQSPEEYKYVLANILLAKKFLKLSGVYKKSNAALPENGQPDTRGGLGAVGIENWILQNGGSFEAASKSFISVANECKNLEEFKEKYAIWDFGENYISANSNIYPHDNFVYNMNETGFERMKIALTKYLEIMQTRKSNKIGFEDLAGQVVEEIKDSEYMCAIRNLTEKMKNLQEDKIRY